VKTKKYFSAHSASLEWILLILLSLSCQPTVKVEEKVLETKAFRTVLRGERLYGYYCMQCHGVEGKGDGIYGINLLTPPRDHTDGTYMNKRRDQKLYDVIAIGGRGAGLSNLMPPWGRTLRDEDIWDLVAYIRSLAEPPYIPPEMREEEEIEESVQPEKEEKEELF